MGEKFLDFERVADIYRLLSRQLSGRILLDLVYKESVDYFDGGELEAC